MVERFGKKPPFKSIIYLYKIFMILLSLTIVFLSVWDLVFPFSEATELLVSRIDWLICGVFATDLLVHLKLAKDKKKFIKTSIIEIIVITPFTIFLKLPGFFRNFKFFQKKTISPSFTLSPGSRTILDKVNLLLSQKFIIRSIAFIMKPSVARVAKFFNLSRNYFDKTKKSQ
ncbi:hypothetical protein [Clostridium formicaceticum]|uniref:Ion transport domain-containing protein n=1 Tax=Clostridium formicaceticum TaxID=1497 RepID=A0AAC9RG88_9CLOT|nr:hypothetical protein [Clostridium formicaceticum]AOY75896.1 hypothetical protein BJL90_08315 [Clostridium formicaceticum]ARE86239.1 hypothetical protein CLFO_05610 [Clostridium formicaceticum]